ncbi:hypothetical protein V8E36_005282 [Tilletia maclaganii]
MAKFSSLARDLIEWINTNFPTTLLGVFMVLFVTLRSPALTRAMIDCREALIRYDAQPSLSAAELKDIREGCVISGLAFYASIALLMVILPTVSTSVAYPINSFSDRVRLACHEHTCPVALGIVFFSRTRLFGRLEEFFLRSDRRFHLVVSRGISSSILKELRPDIKFAETPVDPFANQSIATLLRTSAVSLLRQTFVATLTGATGFLVPILWILYDDPTIAHEADESTVGTFPIFMLLRMLFQRRTVLPMLVFSIRVIALSVIQPISRPGILTSPAAAPAPLHSVTIGSNGNLHLNLLSSNEAREANLDVLVFCLFSLLTPCSIIVNLLSACRGYDLIIAERHRARHSGVSALRQPPADTMPAGFVRLVDDHGKYPEMVHLRTHTHSRPIALPVYTLALRTIRTTTLAILGLAISDALRGLSSSSATSAKTARKSKQTGRGSRDIGILDLLRPDAKYYAPLYPDPLVGTIFANGPESGEQDVRAPTPKLGIEKGAESPSEPEPKIGGALRLRGARESGRPVSRPGNESAARTRRGGFRAIYELWTVWDTVWIKPLHVGDEGAQGDASAVNGG